MNILDIPGYAAAVAQEQLVRDAAFLGLNESICGFEVRPMTFRHFLVLRMLRSPFVEEKRRTPSWEDVAAFLWVLSPTYEPARENRNRFLKRCLGFREPKRPLIHFRRAMRRWGRRRDAALKRMAAVVDACRSYAEEAFQDRPSRPATVENEASYYSDAAHYCGGIAREYHWSEEAILNMPLKRLFQYAKEINQHHDSKMPLCNPSDRVVSEFLAARNAKLQNQ